MVYVRREIFANKFRHVVKAEIARRVERKLHTPVEIDVLPWWKKAFLLFKNRKKLDVAEEPTHSAGDSQTEHPHRGRSLGSRVRPDMIRRMDDAPKLINPSGNISEHQEGPAKREHPGASVPTSVSETVEAEMAGMLEELESDDSLGREK